MGVLLYYSLCFLACDSLQLQDSGKMKSLSALYSLSVCVLLSNPAQPTNDSPCQPSKYNNAHNTFIKRHLRQGIPSTLNKTVWEKYLRDNADCSRPTQSFLPVKDQEKVDAVCSSAGGKRFKQNLCISTSRFNFVTVRSEVNTCVVVSIKSETKYLILACDVLENRCLPVHFEGNPKSLSPDNNAPPCGRAASRTVTTLQLLAVLAVSFMTSSFSL